MFSDPPYTTAYNVTISSSLTPSDLSGFDIIISWTVSDNSACGGLLHMYIRTHIHVCDNFYPIASYVDIHMYVHM